MLNGTYQSSLVIVSVLVAIFASYTALNLAGRVTQSSGKIALWWMAGGATAMGIGIWSMHFVGMLAFRLPIAVGYDLGITFLSLVLAIVVSALALWQVSRPQFPTHKLVFGAILMGGGINAMHYTGMAAMRMEPGIAYDVPLFAASVMIAITASGVALWMAFTLRNNLPSMRIARAGAAVVMGIAIVGMHYTGMAAANFPLGAICRAAGAGFNQDSLAIMVIFATLGILSVATMASIYDARLERRTQLFAALEASLAERQNLLTREREARAQAEQLNAMKDEFLSVLSHELRTPLSAIVGWAQMIRRGKVSDTVLQQGMETIERNAHLQAKLIDDLLDMSKIISGKVTLELGRIDPSALVDQVLAAAEPAASAKKVIIEKALALDVPAIVGDARRLHQVLSNLLGNAIKFTPSGGRIRVRLYRAGEEVAIVVEDSGIGIKPAFLPFVFDRFRQADASTTRKYGGLGLGLSIVKNLLQLHGGSISVASSGEGQGAAFTLTLPAATAAAHGVSGGQPAGTAQEVRRDGEVDLRGLKILVVEDVPDTLHFIAHVLRGASAIVIPAPNAIEALALLKLERPDAIVSDIGLPEMDGFEFIRQVRLLDDQHGGTIPAIALSAFTRVEDRQRALDAGFSVYMEKPFDQRELLECVAKVCQRRAVSAD